MVVLREASRSIRALPLPQLVRQAAPLGARAASTQAEAATALPHLGDIESSSALGASQISPEAKKEFRPWKRQKERKYQLPAAKYQYHPPKYNRGPLHPVQSPPSSDPVARDFVPGPFNLPRLRETFQTTIAPDLLTLTYNHKPPGTESKQIRERLREWDDSSPYHKNRPLRAPRGSTLLRPLEKDITFNNIPELLEVTIASYIPNAIKDPDYLLVARAALLAISGTTPVITETKSNVAQWGVKSGKRAGVKTTIHGNEAYEFLDRCLNFVFPRIKDWPGIEGSTGDSAGNLAWGFTPEQIALFPEIEINYDMYPPKMLPGCRVFVKTSATSDRHARLLLSAMGVPFYGELRD
ncbi:ribosomal protein L5 [Thozetella sp. PMI_491]|nr:ribosomal protein L5 [Thozetella sp. PMI_491]